jgi:hypothetical protein
LGIQYHGFTITIFVRETMSNQTKLVLSLAKLETTTLEDPLQLFYSGIKSQETKNAYKKTPRIPEFYRRF